MQTTDLEAEEIRFFDQKGDAVSLNTVVQSLKEADFPVTMKGRDERFEKLLLNAIETGEQGNPSGGPDFYIGLLRILHHQLGVADSRQASLTVDLIACERIPLHCTEY